MGHVYADQNNWQAAADHFAVATELKADDFDSRINLAIAHRQLNQLAAAQEDLRQALQLDPRLPKPWYLYGCLMLESNRPADAIDPLSKATQLDPTNGDAFFRLGIALMQSGHGDTATGPLLQAAQLLPNSPEPLARLAWVLATHPNEKLRRGSDALFLAGRANEIAKSNSAETLDALAAALAEQHQFAEAITASQKAHQIAEKLQNAALAQQIADHLSHFQKNEPLRDSTLAGADVGEAIR